MKARLTKLVDSILTSFWFVPGGMTFLAVVLAIVSIRLDQSLFEPGGDSGYWFGVGGVAGARALLTTIAGSMITVAGVTFSITIVALTLASSQFGPRLLRNFMSNKTTQLSLGAFIATFIYCVVVLRMINDVGDATFVPRISVDISLALALFSLGLLIYFIHSTAYMIQADSVVESVFRECTHTIDSLCPDAYEDGVEDAPADAPSEHSWKDSGTPVPAWRGGYVQTMDVNAVVAFAESRDIVVRLLRRPGDFVVEGEGFALVLGGDISTEEAAAHLSSLVLFGIRRTPVQDLEFAIEQLVEVAVRALSPGVNDPFTAMACIDRLGALLNRLSARCLPNQYCFGSDGRLRVIADVFTFDGVADAAYHQIRQHARGDVAVNIRLLESMELIARLTASEAYRTTIARHAKMVWNGAEGASLPEADLADVRARYDAVNEALAD